MFGCQGETTPPTSPETPPALATTGTATLTFRQLSLSNGHTCGVDHAQLGDGTTTERHTPSRVAGSRRWDTVIAGWRNSCGVTGAGRAFCWGSNDSGQLGDGTKDDHPTPVAVVAPM
jgi:alpha-tubulin suppressor-like RCC1 family protein